MSYVQATAHKSNPYTTTYMILECTKEKRNSYHSNTSIAAATLSIQKSNQSHSIPLGYDELKAGFTKPIMFLLFLEKKGM
jgi:hypothetical protein